MANVSKADLIIAMERINPLVATASRAQIQLIVDTFLQAIINTSRQKHRIELRGFGVFTVVPTPVKQARNPRTGEQVEIPAGFRIKFKAGSLLKEAVDTGLDDID